MNPPSMLVLDAFRGHLTLPVKTKLKDVRTELVVIPSGMTSQLQPLDVCLNKPFKDHVRRLYQEWMSNSNAALSLTPTGRLKRASLATLAQWVADAWAAIPEQMVLASFRKCCISNAMNGSEDDDVWLLSSDKEASGESDESDGDSD